MANEYKAIKVNQCKQNYHRYIVEVLLGRKLAKNEVVHHKDGNKSNNESQNLQILNVKEHSQLHGRKTRNSAKLRPIDIPLIRMLFREGYNNKRIAERFNVARRTIADVRTGHTWSWIQDFKEQEVVGATRFERATS